MKKSIIISLLLILKVGYSTSQTVYQIPGASQQPRWVFPIYIEDAIGQKDTLYYGFSPGAGGTGMDTVFGEYPIPFDTIKLVATTEAFTGNWVYKVSILDTSYKNTWWQLSIAKTYPPTKFKWDVSTLRSDSLPFPDQSPLPNAELHIDWYYSHNITPCPGQGFAILVTDTASGTFCFMKDSMVMDNVFPGPVDIMLGLQFRPWTGLQPVGVQQVEKNKLKIYPVPASGYFIIDMDETGYSLFNAELFTSEGISVLNKPMKNKERLITSNIPNGFYMLKLTTANFNTVFKKIIIDH